MIFFSLIQNKDSIWIENVFDRELVSCGPTIHFIGFQTLVKNSLSLTLWKPRGQIENNLRPLRSQKEDFKNT